jgi:trypsin
MWYPFSRHSQFNPTTKDYDVAVLKLASSVSLGPTVQVIEFIQPGQDPADGSEIAASGWGDSERQLQSITLPIVNRDTCNQSYGGQITNRMICAGSEAGKGTCPGDRGGPVTYGGKLAGIISQTRGCELFGLPDVFTDVANSNIQSWIKSQ